MGEEGKGSEKERDKDESVVRKNLDGEVFHKPYCEILRLPGPSCWVEEVGRKVHTIQREHFSSVLQNVQQHLTNNCLLCL